MKILVLVLIVALGAFFVGRHESGSATDIAGDANCDGVTNSLDALTILKVEAGLAIACIEPARTWHAPDGTPYNYITPAQLEAASDVWFADWYARHH